MGQGEVKKVGCAENEQERDRVVLGREVYWNVRMTIIWEQNLNSRMTIKRERREYLWCRILSGACVSKLTDFTTAFKDIFEVNSVSIQMWALGGLSYLIYLQPLVYAFRMVWMLARKHNQRFTFLKFHTANYTSINNNESMTHQWVEDRLSYTDELQLIAHTALCCHPGHLLSCMLLMVKKQVYQQRGLCFLYQLLHPMQLIPEINM
jgi:ABC-type siderophore export system fused ATPase/permease subunit